MYFETVWYLKSEERFVLCLWVHHFQFCFFCKVSGTICVILAMKVHILQEKN